MRRQRWRHADAWSGRRSARRDLPTHGARIPSVPLLDAVGVGLAFFHSSTDDLRSTLHLPTRFSAAPTSTAPTELPSRKCLIALDL